MDSATDVPVVKRGRGRPPKNAAAALAPAKATKEPAASVAKPEKKRGRPANNTHAENVVEELDLNGQDAESDLSAHDSGANDATVVIPKKRGRPPGKKAATAKPAENTQGSKVNGEGSAGAEKRKRGRPPKKVAKVPAGVTANGSFEDSE